MLRYESLAPRILQIHSLTLVEKLRILDALQATSCDDDLDNIGNQLNLFDLQPGSGDGTYIRIAGFTPVLRRAQFHRFLSFWSSSICLPRPSR